MLATTTNYNLAPMLDQADIDWRTLRINPSIYAFLDYMSGREYCDKISLVVLFGSVARGQAKLGSDIDIAVISDTPLTRDELKSVHPDESNSHFYSMDYRIINVLTHKLSIENMFNVGYHIKREGLILYAG